MSEVVLDANVLVAVLYAADVHHERALKLIDRLEAEGHTLVLVDFLVFEAMSVLCRRAAQRKTDPPDLSVILPVIQRWFAEGEVRFLTPEVPRLADEVLDVVQASDGVLNSNDALLVALQREGQVDKLASFDVHFDRIAGFPRTG